MRLLETEFALAAVLIFLLKVIALILGYLTIKLGHNLVSSGVKGEFKFAADLRGLKADLASFSPGLLFVLLGTFLIGYAIFVDKPIEIKEAGGAAEPPNVQLPEPDFPLWPDSARP